MSTAPNKKIDWDSFGWAILGLLSLFAWLVTMIGQFIGVAWYFPWIFFGLFVFLVMKTSKVMKAKEDKAPVANSVMTPNELRESQYKLPHLTSIPGQYTRRPCENPTWISIPLYRDYEIHCGTHEVRNKRTGDIVEPGFDPRGINKEIYLELTGSGEMPRYIELSWVVATALGKGHK